MSTSDGSAQFEARAADWLSVEEAMGRILRRVRPLDAESVPLDGADGRVLAEPLVANATLPPWSNSAMDGYAVRAADIARATPSSPAHLRVAGRVWAGHTETVRVPPRGAVRIMTGAPLPPGADTVVKVEDTDQEAHGGHVLVTAAVERGRYVRPAGEDMRVGQTVLEAGRTVTAGVTGLAAALGRNRLTVHRRPRVALIATGDELRPPERYDDVVKGKGIPESNTPMLAAMVRGAGGDPGERRIAGDDEEDLAAHLSDAAYADVLVTIGGASMGEADLVKRVLDRAGFRQDFWRVRLRPGSPFSFGLLPREDALQPVFGLPGNPASAFVTFELFVRPFLRSSAGHEARFRPRLRCVAGEDLRGPTDLTAYLRVSLDRTSEPPTAHLTGPQGSGLVSGLALADGLAILPPGTGSIGREEVVDVLLLDGNATDEYR
ncbi:MAG: gephyrin-like molybdotransferase Glp [Gemmatimonadota bacterium]|nr:gephyrin-like molybdotransferase Glp [Gemmatimonadota bacterium]